MRKKILSWLLIAVFLLGVALLVYVATGGSIEGIKDFRLAVMQLFRQNGVVFGEVKEEAVFPKVIKKAKISIGGKSTEVNERGEYEIFEVPLGRQLLTAETPSHEKYRKEVEIFRGRNRAEIFVSLAPDETIRRWLTAYKLGIYEEAYEYIHPEDQAAISKAEYVDFFKNFMARRNLTIVDFTVGKPKILNRWVNEKTRKAYRNIAEVEISIKFSTVTSGRPSEFTDTARMHLAKMSRQWKGFWTKPAD